MAGLRDTLGPRAARAHLRARPGQLSSLSAPRAGALGARSRCSPACELAAPSSRFPRMQLLTEL